MLKSGTSCAGKNDSGVRGPMSGSNRSKRTPPIDWALPVIGIILAVAIAWGVGWLQARETYNRTQTPAAYEAAAKDDVERTCGGQEPAAVFVCVNEKVKAAYQIAHDEQDLSAQQRAASSAMIAAFIAFATLLVSVAGVWFVKRTLDATLTAVEDTSEATNAMREANKISKDNAGRNEQMAMAQTRAYMSVILVQSTYSAVDGNRHRFTIEGKYINSGQSPARGLHLVLNIANAESQGFNFGPFTQPRGDVPAGYVETPFTIAGDIPDEMWPFVAKTGQAWTIIGVHLIARYSDVFGRNIDETFSYFFGYKSGEPGPFQMAQFPTR